MATTNGREGVVKIGANTVLEVTGFTLEQSADTIEDTELSDTAKSFISDKTSWNGSVECHLDEDDSTGQAAMTIGASVSLDLYPEGATSGDMHYSGSAIITGVSISNAIGSTVTASFTFQGTGTLTKAAVV